MISLEFRDGLVNNRFAYYNEYRYDQLESLNIYYTEEDNEVPFILRGNIPTRQIHVIKDGFTEVMFSDYSRQLNGRVLTTVKIKEVLDGARCPLQFRIGAKTYLIGKGFLADFSNRSNLQVLFMATYDKSKGEPSGMTDIKFYISRGIYRAEYKKIQPVIKDFMGMHPGDVLITSDIDRYVGRKIEVPAFKTIKERREYDEKLIDFCLNKVAEKIEKKQLATPKVTAERKRKKEEETLREFLTGNPRPSVVIPSAIATDFDVAMRQMVQTGVTFTDPPLVAGDVMVDPQEGPF